MKSILLFFFIAISIYGNGQSKMGYTWIVGNNASFAKFDPSISIPQIGQKYSSSSANAPFFYFVSHSNICDSSNGEIILSTTGMILYDSIGNVVEGGDSLQPLMAYSHNTPPSLPATQGSLIIPKGDDNEFYVFIPTVSDSLYSSLWTNPNSTKAPFDLLRYNIVDMKLNGGNGKVVQKNKVLLNHIELSKVVMQACKHANGVDWWLLKQGLDSNIIYKFLISKDSIRGPFIQSFPQPKWGLYDLRGQSCFNKEGNKFCVVMGKSNNLFIADFDRCSGELSNSKVYNIPIDSTLIPFWDNQNSFDSISAGVCFSENGDFIYISKAFNIYQFEQNQPDSILAWYRVKHGADTTSAAFEKYGQLYRAPNNRIYIGKWGGSLTQFSVIDNPNNKGAACNFCRKCFRIDTADGGLTSPPNMPDYELGPDTTKACWPLAIQNVNEEMDQVKIYPNPTSSVIIIEYTCTSAGKFELTNTLGQAVLATQLSEGKRKVQMQVNNLSKGIYYYKCSFDGCEDVYGKLIIE